jgi:hypothetical protein
MVLLITVPEARRRLADAVRSRRLALGLTQAGLALRANAEKLAELDENPKWGSAEEREAMVTALDEFVVQAEALSMALSEPAEGEEMEE